MASNYLNFRLPMLCFALTGFSASVMAGPIAGVGVRLWGDSLISIDNVTPVAGVTTQTISNTESVSGTNLTYSYGATGTATNALLSTFATASLTSGGTTFAGSVPNLTPSHYAYALATAGFLDNLNITAPGQSGAGFLYLTFQVNGTSVSSDPLVDAHGQVGVQSPGGNSFLNLGTGTFSANLAPISFQFGSAFNMLYFLSSTVKFNMASPLAGANGTADFSHTSLFPTLLVRNANGDLLNSYSVLSQQGITYDATVPEPATATLAVVGLIALAWTKRRQR